MKLLLANLSLGRFRHVLTAKARKDGGIHLPSKWCGTLESYAVRSAARSMAADDAVVDVFVELGSQRYRVTRIG